MSGGFSATCCLVISLLPFFLSFFLLLSLCAFLSSIKSLAYFISKMCIEHHEANITLATWWVACLSTASLAFVRTAYVFEIYSLREKKKKRKRVVGYHHHHQWQLYERSAVQMLAKLFAGFKLAISLLSFGVFRWKGNRCSRCSLQRLAHTNSPNFHWWT